MPRKLTPVRGVYELHRDKRSMPEAELRDKLQAEVDGPRRIKVVERLVLEIRRRERARWKAFIAALVPKTGFHPEVKS
jgi:hypothetical protein